MCIAARSQILTPDGVRFAVDIRTGDMVSTLNRGDQPVIWAGRSRIRFQDDNHSQRPIVFPKGWLGSGSHAFPLRVSPQHLISVTINGTNTLVPAKGFQSWEGVYVDEVCAYQDYVAFLCPEHSVLAVSGYPCESLFPGPQAIKRLSAVDRGAIEELVPGVADNTDGYGPICQRVIGPRRFRKMRANHQVTVPNVTANCH